ncbi:MAG: nucleotidyl transferase AbiEii/AbiGii toxin family protein [Verrucomicrobiota bacterium]
MQELVNLAQDIQAFIESQRWEFCFIGGLALQRWGEQRFTRDVDLTILTDFGNEESFIDVFLSRYSSRVPNMKAFAIQNRVLLLLSNENIPFDISLGGMNFEKSMVQRSSLCEYSDGIFLRTCSAEDLIVMKAFADRDRDWIDIQGILIRQQNKLDWDYVITQLTPLCQCKENPEILSKLQKLRQKTTLR